MSIRNRTQNTVWEVPQRRSKFFWKTLHLFHKQNLFCKISYIQYVFTPFTPFTFFLNRFIHRRYRVKAHWDASLRILQTVLSSYGHRVRTAFARLQKPFTPYPPWTRRYRVKGECSEGGKSQVIFCYPEPDFIFWATLPTDYFTRIVLLKWIRSEELPICISNSPGSTTGFIRTS